MRVSLTALAAVVLITENCESFQPSTPLPRPSAGIQSSHIRTDGIVLFSATTGAEKLAAKSTSKVENNTKKKKTNPTNNKNIDNRKRQRKPWRANYATSTATQAKIKSSAKIRASPIIRATSVLRTLLNTDPALSNPSNLVCALTLSAKIVPANCQIGRREEFRKLLFEALEILRDLAVEKRMLNTRQLANAAWAIAKHYSNDDMILPPYYSKDGLDGIGSAAAMSQGEAGGKNTLKERWDLNGEEKYQVEKRVLGTLEDIAIQLMETMERDEVGSEKNARKPMNEVEMSMVCWAYAVLYPRNVPAGWELPPRIGQMEKVEQEAIQRMTVKSIGTDNGVDNSSGITGVESNDEETITFETVQGTESEWEEEEEEEFQPTSIVDKLFDTMANSIIRPDSSGQSMIQRCRWKELSTIAWSYANRGYCQSSAALDLILDLADSATARIEKASWVGSGSEILPRDVSEVAWALGVMQSDNYYISESLDQFVSVIQENLLFGNDRPLKNWKSADCVQMAIALGHGRLDRQSLLREIYGEALRSMQGEALRRGKESVPSANGNKDQKKFQDFELVVLLWVQARLYLTKESGQVFDDFAEILPQTLLYRMHMSDDASSNSLEDIQTAFERIHLGPQEQANVAWSLTVLEKYNSQDAVEFLRCIFNVCSASCKDGDPIRLEHAHQLWQSMFILEQECPDAVEAVDVETFEFLKNMWNDEKARQKASSARHKALSETLNFMGVKHYNEHDEDIDLALVLKTDSKWTSTAEHTDSQEFKERIAVEFDGPSHFTKIQKSLPSSGPGEKPSPPRALGHTVLKYKLLKKQGWTIVRIPFYEFDKIPFWASMERQRYLQRKLKTHSNLNFSGVDVSEYKAPVANRESRFD